MRSFWQRLKHHFIPAEENSYRPHLLRRGWMVMFLAVVLATEGFLVAGLVARQSGGSFLAAIIQSEIISLTNSERTQNNAGVLVENPQLDAAAQAKADDMARLGYFSHTGPDGKTPWQWIAGSGYRYEYAGENLAVRFVDSSDVVNAWMNSPTHRANIVKPQYTQIGIGIAQGMYQGSPATFVVQYFGSPLAAAPAAPVATTQKAPPAPVAAAPVQTVVLGEQAPAQTAPAPAQTAPPAVSPVKESSSLTQSISRQLMRTASEPRNSASWVLGGIALFLVLLVGLSFMSHIQVQALHLLLPGVAVAGIALFFIAFNGVLLSPMGGAAAAAELGLSQQVVIDPAAAVAP